MGAGTPEAKPRGDDLKERGEEGQGSIENTTLGSSLLIPAGARKIHTPLGDGGREGKEKESGTRGSRK